MTLVSCLGPDHTMGSREGAQRYDACLVLGAEPDYTIVFGRPHDRERAQRYDASLVLGAEPDHTMGSRERAQRYDASLVLGAEPDHTMGSREGLRGMTLVSCWDRT